MVSDKPKPINHTELTPTTEVRSDQVSKRESIELRMADLSSPAAVHGLARRC